MPRLRAQAQPVSLSLSLSLDIDRWRWTRDRRVRTVLWKRDDVQCWFDWKFGAGAWGGEVIVGGL